MEMRKKEIQGKYLFITNPSAGKGLSAGRIEKLRSFMGNKGIDYEIKQTARRGDAGTIALWGIEKGFNNIISVGGDGTSSCIANAIAYKDINFGVIPFGSGNDFPKACGIPLNVDDALGTVVEGKPALVDVGKFNSRYFINGLGIGLDGAVAHRFRKFKIFGGFLGYFIGAAVEALLFKGFDAELNAGNKTYRGRYVLCGACNGPYQGGRFRLAPEAQVDDGKLDIYMIDDMQPVTRFMRIGKVMNGTHKDLSEVNIIKTEKASLRVYRNLPAHMDGEPLEIAPGDYEISVCSGALRVILPDK